MSFPSDKFNLNQITQVSEGDHEFEDDLIESYKSELEETFSKIEPEFSSGQNHEDCVRLAHDVKGSSGNVGAEGVREVGRVMEELARERKYKEALALLPKARAEFEEFCKIWEAYKQTW